MFKIKNLTEMTNEELLNHLIVTAQDAYYHHNSTDQEDAINELPKIKNEVLKRMKNDCNDKKKQKGFSKRKECRVKNNPSEKNEQQEKLAHPVGKSFDFWNCEGDAIYDEHYRVESLKDF